MMLTDKELQTLRNQGNDDAADEIESLRAKLEALRQQKPVAFGLYSGWALKATYLKEHEACDQRDRRQLTADLGGSLEAYRVAPLYPAPGAQSDLNLACPSVQARLAEQWGYVRRGDAQSAVPEGWQLVPIDPAPAMLDAAEKLDWNNEDVRGNCCNQWYVMLAAAPKPEER